MRLFFSFIFITVFLFLLIKVNAQITPNSLWIWKNGDSGAVARAVFGDKGIAALDNKPSGRIQSVSWKDSEGNQWFFGGLDNGSFPYRLYNDLWKYNSASNQWAWVNGDSAANRQGIYGVKGTPAAANKPGARYGAFSWTDASGNFWLFGGFYYGTEGYRHYSDLWKYNPATNEWAWINGSNEIQIPPSYGRQGIASENNTPGARTAGATWTDVDGNLWLFGGFTTNNQGVQNDLWKYDIAADQWTWMKGSNAADNAGNYGAIGIASENNQPAARNNQLAWTDALGNFWLFGGEGPADQINNNRLYNDLWKYEPSSNNWTWISGSNIVNQTSVYGTIGVPGNDNIPGARRGSYGWIDVTGTLWFFGGETLPVTPDGAFDLLNDLWKYDPRSNQWTWVKGSATTNQYGSYAKPGRLVENNSPGGRGNGIAWTDATGNFLLFGGRGNAATSNSFLNDVWALGNFSLLPVTFSSIKVYQQNSNIKVEWTVQNEINVKKYEAEKSSDGVVFTKVAVQNATGNNSMAANYSWLDVNAFAGANFYRIRSVDADGKTAFSQTVKVTMGKSDPRYEIHPNPLVNGAIQLQLINQPTGNYQLRLLNSWGQTIQSEQIAHAMGSSTETITPRRQLAKGMYVLEITAPDKRRKLLQVIY